MAEKLLAAMKGKKSLNGWDVAVSYDLNTLSQNITDKMWKSDDIHNPVPFEVDDGAAQYHMKVYRPIFKFLPREKHALVTIPIGGLIRRNNKDTELDKGKYNLEVEVPIVGILGKDTTGEKPKTREELAVVTKTPMHTEIHFPVIETEQQKKDPGTYHLTFHFGGISPQDWKLKSPPDSGPIAATLAGAKRALGSWIAQYLDGAENTIARINNGGDKNTNLQPKSFMFATLGTDAKPILTIYLKVYGGTSEVGQTKVDFFDAHRDISPIPTDHTVSIIIANEIIAKRIFEPGLSAKFGVTRKGNADGQGGDDGFEYLIKVRETLFRKEIRSREVEDLLIIHHIHHDEINVHLADHDLKLRIINGEAVWNLDFCVYLNWEEYVQRLLPQGSIEQPYGGRVKLQFYINKTSKINIDSSNIENGAFSLAASDVKILASPAHRESEVGKIEVLIPNGNLLQIEKILASSGNRIKLDNRYNHLQMDFKTIEIPMQKVNLLLTENIFASRGNLIELDKTYGVKTPHDVLLLGNVEWAT